MHIHISESFSGADENLSLIGRVLEREKKIGRGLGTVSKVFALQTAGPREVALQNTYENKKPGTVVWTFNPGTAEAETGSSLRLAVQPR